MPQAFELTLLSLQRTRNYFKFVQSRKRRRCYSL